MTQLLGMCERDGDTELDVTSRGAPGSGATRGAYQRMPTQVSSTKGVLPMHQARATQCSALWDLSSHPRYQLISPLSGSSNPEQPGEQPSAGSNQQQKQPGM